MQLPVREPDRSAIKQHIQGLKGNARFAGFLAWIKSELDDRDKTNRYIGQENKSSEAQCLADMLEIVDACWAPEADLNSKESGAE